MLAERFTQDMESIPWVRCASGNVFRKSLTHFYKKKPPPMIYIVGKLWISAFADLRAK